MLTYLRVDTFNALPGGRPGRPEMKKKNTRREVSSSSNTYTFETLMLYYTILLPESATSLVVDDVICTITTYISRSVYNLS